MIDNSKEPEFAGKKALVVGGSSGIGKAVSLALAGSGAAVGVVSSRDSAKADAVVKLIKEEKGEARSFTGDVTKIQEIKALVKEFLSVFGDIDILVNAAGVFYPTMIGQTREEDFDRMININLKGTFFMTDEVAPVMKKKQYGKIINISSRLGMIGSKENGLYCATKAGIIALTKSFALQLAPYNINVNAVAPGNVATPMNEHVRTKPEYAEQLAFIEATTPSKRPFSEPEDAAEGVLFLASDRSRSMHGSIIIMDEGRLAGF